MPKPIRKPLKPKEPYKRPEIKTYDGRIVGARETRTRGFVLEDGRKMYSRENISQEELNILRKALQAGISVEIPFMFEPKGEKRIMGYIGGGKKLGEILLIGKITPAQKFSYIEQISQIMSGLHNLNIEHWHPLVRNFVVDKFGKVRLIDFKYAKEKQIDWNDAESIWNAFRSDYEKLTYSLLYFDLSYEEMFNFFKSLLQRYKKIKKETIKVGVLKLIWPLVRTSNYSLEFN